MFSDSSAANYKSFLSKPLEDEKVLQITRSICDYENKSKRFTLSTKCFTRQYAHLYSVRLMKMRAKLESSAKAKWGNDVIITQLCDLQPGVKCVVIGTVFKDMQMRPSILKEISDEHNVIPQPLGSRFADDSDKLIIEDELQRIVLQGNMDMHSLITGIVVAILGVVPPENSGKFIVDEMCCHHLPSQIPLPIVEQDRFVAFVSGFEIGSKNEDMFRLQLLVDILTGHVGSLDQQTDAANIVATIIAGNSLSRDTQDKDVFTKAKYLTKNTSAGSLEAMKSLDDIVVQLASNMNVYVMPGEFDPANHFLPQQPLHKCMFPQGSRYNTLTSVTNPHDCIINGVKLLGCSGQSVDDISRYSKLDDRIDILQKTLEWGHLAPTCPDSLACYPFYDDDPFILEECPHVYFVANQPRYQTKLYQGCDGQQVRLITIPKFSETGTCILLNLKTLECLPLIVASSISDK